MIKFITKVFIKIASKLTGSPDWVIKGEVSSKGSELRYWNEKGIGLGTDIYLRYLEAFKLDGDLSNYHVADFGCGPFGGILSHVDCLKPYPIDVLADEYNELNYSKFDIYNFDGNKVDINNNECNVVFSTNALDHTPNPKKSISEIYRILKPGGEFYLHVHLRYPHELNKTHPVSWSKEFAFDQLSEFDILWHKELTHDWINDNPYRTLLLKAKKNS
jgi:SAM-dependent methyltransferase